MTRDELIAALEAATGPDRGLDAEIKNAVDGRVRGDRYTAEDAALIDSLDWRDIPAYTASLDSAMTLVPEGHSVMTLHAPEGPHTEGLRAHIGRVPGATPTVRVWNQHRGNSAEAATIPLALCIASLKALTPTINTREGE